MDDRLPAGLKGRRRAVVAGMLAGEAYEQPLAQVAARAARRHPRRHALRAAGGQPAHVHRLVHAGRLHRRAGLPCARRARPLRLGRPLLRHPPRRGARPAGTRRPDPRRARPVQHRGRARSGSSPPSATSRDGAMPMTRTSASACWASAASRAPSASSWTRRSVPLPRPRTARARHRRRHAPRQPAGAGGHDARRRCWPASATGRPRRRRPGRPPTCWPPRGPTSSSSSPSWRRTSHPSRPVTSRAPSRSVWTS